MATKPKHTSQAEEIIPLINVSEIEAQREQKRAHSQYVNGQISRAVGLKDSILFSGIFGTFMTEVTQKFLEEIGKYFLFPMSALAHAIQIVLAWRDFKLSNKDQRGGALGRAVVETISGLAIVGTVVGALTYSVVFGALTPLLFGGTVFAKTLFKGCSSIYYGYKGSKEENPELRATYYQAAQDNAVAAGAGLVSTFVVTMVMKLGWTIFAPIGVAVGIVSGAYAIYTGVREWRKQNQRHAAEQEQSPVIEPDTENTLENDLERDLAATVTHEQKKSKENDILFMEDEKDEERLVNNNNNARSGQSTVVPFPTLTAPKPIYNNKDRATLFATTGQSQSLESHLDKKVDKSVRERVSEIKADESVKEQVSAIKRVG